MEELISRGVEEIIDRTRFAQMLESGQTLRLKLGVDPSSPDIHLGHTVVLRKLRQLQERGHTVIFLLGDATARIGDPSGRSKTRPVLSQDEIESNSQTYLNQVGKILDLDQVEVRRNSEWLDKLDFATLLKLASNFTVAQLVERDDFKQRLASGQELALHELLYPVMQAYDSVMLEADVEFGGTDQRFNLLAGRDLQKKLGQKPQQLFMCKLLVGTDGSQKMSKSLGNYIGITDQPGDIYGKVMSIPDELIGPYYELCTDIKLEVIDELVKTLADGVNPRDAKASLAREIVRLYLGADAALAAEERFNRLFRDKERPDNLPTLEIRASDQLTLSDRLIELNLADSKSEARRLIDQRGVKINDTTISSDDVINLKTDDIVQVGKRRFVKVKLK